MDYPEIARWEAVRERIRQNEPLLDNPGTHDDADIDNWADLNSIFCPALAMGLYYIPKIYSLWPAYWHDYVLREYDTGKWCAIAGPRRRAKSAMFRLHQLYTMLTLRYTFSTHICLSPELVLEHSTAVIDQLENNRRLHEAFQIHPGSISRQEHFEIQVGNAHRTTLKFEWMTRDGKPRGTGRHLVGVDDIDDVDDSPYIMEKYYNKIHASIMGVLEAFETEPAQLIISGNLVGHHCNMMLFQKRDAKREPDKWSVFVIPALEKGDTQHITKTEVGESTWPDRFTTEQTRDQINKMNMGRLLSGDMELQNELADLGKMIWKEEMFELRFKPDTVQPHQCESRVYVDTSQKTAEAGDDWALGRITKVVEGPHKGEFWIEEVHLDPMDPDTAINIALDLCIGNGSRKLPQCKVIKAESKTDKGIDPWLNDLQKTARRERGMYVSVEMIVATKDKRTRSVQAVPLGVSRSLRTPEVWDAHMERCIDQLCTFTGESGQHLKAIDDGHDMVVMGLNDLKDVESKSENNEDLEPLKMRGKLKGVAA